MPSASLRSEALPSDDFRPVTVLRLSADPRSLLLVLRLEPCLLLRGQLEERLNPAVRAGSMSGNSEFFFFFFFIISFFIYNLSFFDNK